MNVTGRGRLVKRVPDRKSQIAATSTYWPVARRRRRRFASTHPVRVRFTQVVSSPRGEARLSMPRLQPRGLAPIREAFSFLAGACAGLHFPPVKLS